MIGHMEVRYIVLSTVVLNDIVCKVNYCITRKFQRFQFEEFQIF